MEEQPQPLPEEQPEAPKPRCPNCDKKLPKEAKFCPKCGQKQGTELLKMTELLSKVWTKLFHVDNKFLRMSWHLLIPARVTIEYFKGHIKRYPHPIQFFFICMFLLLVYVNQTPSKGLSLNLFDLMKGENVYILKGKVDYYDALQQAWDSIPEALRTDTSRLAFDSLIDRTSKTIRTFRNDSLSTESFFF